MSWPTSSSPYQKGDEFLFNVLIAPVAITVSFVTSLTAALRAVVSGRIHSRGLATILIAIGAFVAPTGDRLLRFGVSDFVDIAKLLAVASLVLRFASASRSSRSSESRSRGGDWVALPSADRGRPGGRQLRPQGDDPARSTPPASPWCLPRARACERGLSFRRRSRP